MQTVLRANNVTKVYGSISNKTQALKNFSFSVQEGEFLGIMGPSGAGKSTLLNVVSTIDAPTTGQILYENLDVQKLSDTQLADFRRRNLGFIFQDFNLLDTLTVKENIILPLAISKVNHREIEKRVSIIAERLNIKDILHKYPVEISGGQKQRTAAARAVITGPRLILADEPTGALDSKASQDLLGSLKSLNEHQRSTILMVTHDPFAASYCSRIIFIKDGEIFSEIYTNGDRKAFYNKIMSTLATIGGGVNDLL